jgi:hypothetical protein
MQMGLPKGEDGGSPDPALYLATGYRLSHKLASAVMMMLIFCIH